MVRRPVAQRKGFNVSQYINVHRKLCVKYAQTDCSLHSANIIVISHIHEISRYLTKRCSLNTFAEPYVHQPKVSSRRAWDTWAWDIVPSTFHDSTNIYREEKDEASPVKTPSGKSAAVFLPRDGSSSRRVFSPGRLVAGEKQHGRNGGIRCHSRILSGSFYPFVRSKSCGRRVHLFVTWPASWTSRNGEDAASAGQTPRNLRPGGSPSPPGTTPSFLRPSSILHRRGIGNLSLKR